MTQDMKAVKFCPMVCCVKNSIADAIAARNTNGALQTVLLYNKWLCSYHALAYNL